MGNPIRQYCHIAVEIRADIRAQDRVVVRVFQEEIVCGTWRPFSTIIIARHVLLLPKCGLKSEGNLLEVWSPHEAYPTPILTAYLAVHENHSLLRSCYSFELPLQKHVTFP